MAKYDLDDLLKDLGDENGEKSQDEKADKGLFVRKAPEETPRPPDLTGAGLDGEIDTTLAAQGADPTRLRPTDALARIEAPEENLPVVAQDLAAQMLQTQLVTPEQLATAERVVRQTPGRRLSQVFIEMGIEEVQVQAAVAAISRLPFERVDPEDPNSFDIKAINKLGIEYCKSNTVLPLRKEGRRYVVGTVNPDDVFLLDDVKRRLNVPSVKHVLVAASDIFDVIDALTEPETDDFNLDDLLADVDDDDVEVVKDDFDDDGGDAESSPVVRYVNHIIQAAVKEGASDIHVEPDEKRIKVRYRIDGVLFEMMSPPRKMLSSLTSRIKIMANLDIAERRLPQDGRIRATVQGRKLDLRVSTVPTPKGEKTVMRILDNRSISVGLDELGFAEDTLMNWKNQISQPHGIILVTGPTGSGKTTTLYSSIRQMDLAKLNISTVEDPVEYNLGSITQIQTHEKIGMTFAKALKALLRQDPDVIMVGEIRDMETATTAIQAAMTGHLVLSTLHTNDAPASLTRLINIGVEPFLVGAACNAVLAQRLGRRICSHCRVEVAMTDEIRSHLDPAGVPPNVSVFTGKGCSRCRETGYSGRVGLYEQLLIDDELRDVIAGSPNVTEFRRRCVASGMRTLKDDGMLKVGTGMTSVEEILRVCQTH